MQQLESCPIGVIQVQSNKFTKGIESALYKFLQMRENKFLQSAIGKNSCTTHTQWEIQLLYI